VPDSLVRDILGEISTENAMRQTAALTARARYPRSQGFFDAAEYVAERAREYGLRNVRIERFPMKRPMWDAAEATLDLVAPESRRLAELRTSPLLLAQGSRDGDVTAELVEEGGEVAGKIVLTSSEPERAWRTLGPGGAAAVVSAWRPDYFGRKPALDAVAWGEAPEDAVAVMISPKQGEELRAQLKQGAVTLRIHTRARRHSKGEIGQVMGEVPGELADHDIVLAAHLDHQLPSANDNASGSGTLLEVLRTLNRLVASGKVAKPRRTLRFWWSTEILSEREYFRRHRDEAKKISMAMVLDQAGGQLGAENNFIAIAGPEWLPAYTDDLIFDLAEHVRRKYAPEEHEPSPMLVAAGGSAQSMHTVYWDYLPLSDHISFEAKEVGIPAIALAVPSLHLIHTDQDTVDRLDPTWMKRSALMTLAPVLYMASAGPAEAKALLETVFRRAVGRIAAASDPKAQLATERKRLFSVRAIDAGAPVAEYEQRLTEVAKAMGR
jgi:aminopeptidase YwaD